MTAGASIVERFGEDADYFSKRLREDSTPEQMKNLGILPSIAHFMQRTADHIDRQSRIIAAHEQQVKDGEAIIAERDAEIAHLVDYVNRIRSYLSDAGYDTIQSEQAWKARALAAESSRDAAVEAAREACARVADSFARKQEFTSQMFLAGDIAAAIRSRVQTGREDGAVK